VYVWLDALLNYVSALGYKGDLKRMSYWDNATHIVGKDILKFHAIYWPAFLMSLNLPLPKHIYAHGWWMRDGQKMSKSIGNVINPREFARIYGIEQLRYYLLREAPFGQDGDFSQKTLVERINTELGNDLGNLLNRLLGMGKKYNYLSFNKTDNSLYKKEREETNNIISLLKEKMAQMNLKGYIEELWRLLYVLNASIARYEPWRLFKEHKDKELYELLGFIAEGLLKVSLCLYPIMPNNAKKIASALTQQISQELFSSLILKGKGLESLKTHIVLQKIPPLFPKIEGLLIAEPNYANTISPIETLAKPQSHSTSNKKDTQGINLIDQIDIKDFKKLDIRIGEILEVSPVPKSNKLLCLTIDIGEEQHRTIISGIAEFYRPNELLHKQICVIANLKPAKFMGQWSNGMILASEDDEGLSLLIIDKKRKNGSKIT